MIPRDIQFQWIFLVDEGMEVVLILMLREVKYRFPYIYTRL